MEYTKYNPDNGCIDWVIVSDESMLTDDDFPNIAGAYDSNYFFIDITNSRPIAKSRPMQSTRQDKKTITPNGEDVVTLSGLPVPCCVMVDENEYKVDDGLFEWGTRRAGEYALRVVAFPFLDWEGAVTAV